MIRIRHAVPFPRTPTGVLAAAAAAVCLIDAALTIPGQPLMVDLEIPLRAAARWAAGGAPYVAAAFAPGTHPNDLPFLYPPPLLPLLAPLAALPRPLVVLPWLLVLLAAATWLLRRLGVPSPAVPLGLAWVPFSEGLVGGNAGVLLVAAFTWAFFDAPSGSWRPRTRADTEPGGPRGGLAAGLAVAAAPALKVSQPHIWVAQLRRRPGAALAGMAGFAVVALLTLPMTGVEVWASWLAQVGRAADPAWTLRGSSPLQLLPPAMALAATGGTVLAVLIVPRRRLAAWAGVLLVLGAPSLRNYGLLFVLPALLTIRREAALAAIILIGCGVAPAVWAGLAVIVIALVAEEQRPVPPTTAGTRTRTLPAEDPPLSADL